MNVKYIEETELISVLEDNNEFQNELNKVIKRLREKKLKFDIQFSTNTENRVRENRRVDVDVTRYNALIIIYGE